MYRSLTRADWMWLLHGYTRDVGTGGGGGGTHVFFPIAVFLVSKPLVPIIRQCPPPPPHSQSRSYVPVYPKYLSVKHNMLNNTNKQITKKYWSFIKSTIFLRNVRCAMSMICLEFIQDSENILYRLESKTTISC